VRTWTPSQHVLELAHVAGPRVGPAAAQGLGREHRRLAGQALGRPLEEVGGEQRQVVHALTQGREHDAHALEAVEQILPARALGHRLIEIAVGGRDHPRFRGHGARAAHPLERALLQEAEDLGLHGERHVADLVQEEGALLGQLEAAGTGPHRAGDGAPLVAEQLRLEKALRDRRAVDRHEGPVPADAQPVDRASQRLLAGAALALDGDRQVGGRRAVGHVHHALERLALADERLEPPRLAVAGSLEHRGLPRAVGGHHDDGRVRRQVAAARDRVEAVRVRPAHVEEDQVVRGGLRPVEQAARGGRDVDVVALAPQRLTADEGEILVVLRDRSCASRVRTGGACRAARRSSG
jgi:hypothetical protein